MPQIQEHDRNIPKAAERRRTFILDTRVFFCFFLKEQFYQNNETQICTKIKKLRTIEARLQMQMYNRKFLLKNTTHHVITCGVSLQVFLQLETLS